MPRFYLHLYNDIDVTDEEEAEFASLEEARARAAREARIMFGEAAIEVGRVVLSHRIDIEDEHGVVLSTVRFGDAVRVVER